MNEELKDGLRIALITCSLLILESGLQSLAHFSFSPMLTYIFPILIFAGLGLGNFFGLLPLKLVEESDLFLLLVLLICSAWLGMVYVPLLAPLWLLLPFIGFGAVLVEIFSTRPLARTVIASGLSGSIFFACVGFIGRLEMEMLLTLAIAAVGVAGLLLTFRKWVWNLLVIVPVMAGLAGIHGLRIPSLLERIWPRFQGAKLVEPAFVSDFFRTDLAYLPALDRYVLMMNGARFGMLSSQGRIREKLGGMEANSSVAYDMPYLSKNGIRDVLVIGPAEGNNVVAALGHGARSVTAVDLNPGVFHFLKNLRPDLVSEIYSSPRVTTVVGEGRRFLETTERRFDLITFQGVQTGALLSGVSTALVESFLFTDEALAAAWNRLSDEGMLFFDEYKSQDQATASLLRSLSTMAQALPMIRDPSRQILLYDYLQAKRNPKSADRVRQMRQGLLIFRQPVVDIEGLKGHLLNMVPEIQFVESRGFRQVRISDNKPYFFQQESIRYWPVLTALALFLSFSLMLWFIFKTNVRVLTGVNFYNNLGLFFLGGAYILFIMAFFGPLTLVSGEPFLLGPLVYFVLYFVALVGGLATLRFSRSVLLISMVSSILWLLASWYGISIFNKQILSSESSLLRYGIITSSIGAIALCFEIPYILCLRDQETFERGYAYTFENLGTLFGAVLSLCMQFWLGFSGAFYAGIVMFILSLVILFLGRQSVWAGSGRSRMIFRF